MKKKAHYHYKRPKIQVQKISSLLMSKGIVEEELFRSDLCAQNACVSGAHGM